MNLFRSSKSLDGGETPKRPPLSGSASMTTVQSTEQGEETDVNSTPNRRKSTESVASASSATSTDSARKKSIFGSIFGSDTPDEKERKEREKKERKEKEKADKEKAEKDKVRKEKADRDAAKKTAFRKSSEFSAEVHLQSPLKLTRMDKSVVVVSMALTTTSEGKFLEIKRGQALFAKIRVECTTSTMETSYGDFSFQIATYGTVINLNANSDPAVLAWVSLIKKTIRECDPYPAYPADPLYKEALIRHYGDVYSVKILAKKPLNLMLERSMEWVMVGKGNPEIEVENGSILYAVNDVCVNLLTFEDALLPLRDWAPPLKLTFRRAPQKAGLLKRHLAGLNSWKSLYMELSEGKFIAYESDQPDEKAIFTLPLLGLVVSLTPAMAPSSAEVFALTPQASADRENCFTVQSGFFVAVLQADSHNEMLEWACILYYGIALANGGGYVLALDALADSTGRSRKEVVAEAIARMTQLEFMSQLANLQNDMLSAAELESMEREIIDGVMDDEEMAGIETSGNFEDSAESLRVSVDEVLWDMVDVVIARSGAELAAAATPTVSAGCEEDGHAADASVSETDSAARLAGSASRGEGDACVAEDKSPLQTQLREDEAALLPAVRAPTKRVAARRESEHVRVFTQVFSEELSLVPHDGSPVLPVTTEDLHRVFQICCKAKTGSSSYINVMQFSSIWRKATGVKGNLFKEMKIFNSSFDTEGKGYATEADFVRGWETVRQGAFGDQILSNLMLIE